MMWILTFGGVNNRQIISIIIMWSILLSFFIYQVYFEKLFVKNTIELSEEDAEIISKEFELFNSIKKLVTG